MARFKHYGCNQTTRERHRLDETLRRQPQQIYSHRMSVVEPNAEKLAKYEQLSP